MEKLWQIEIEDSVTYVDIEAETEEEAIEQALYYWEQRQPQIKWTEIKWLSEEEKNFIKNVNED